LANKRFYGWYILAASFLILILDGGVRFSFGVLIKPLVSEFAWERGTITFAYTLNILVFGLCQPLAGNLLDRYGPRALFTASALITSLGLILTSQVESIYEFYVYYGVVTAVGSSGISIAVVSSTLSRWFKSLRGFVSGLAVSGTALGQFIIIPGLAFLVEGSGWRWAWVILGISLSLLIIPVSLFVMKRDPAEIGQNPYDKGNDQTDKRQEKTADDPSPRASEVLRSRNFFLIGTTYFICGFQDFFLVTQLIPFATDQGFSVPEASMLQGLAGFLSVPGLLFISAISEKLGRKLPLAIIFLPRILCFALPFLSIERVFIYALALLFGFTLMASAPLASGALGASMGGFTYDLTDSYMIAFSLMFLLSIVAVISSLLISEKPVGAPPSV
jgi:sugar phosphate permease